MAWKEPEISNHEITSRSILSTVQSIECFEPHRSEHDLVTLVDAHDSFTHNLVHAFLALGAPVVVLRAREVSLDHVKDHLGRHVVISPGPGKPTDWPLLEQVIRACYKKVPMLGVCLGMQAINEVFGGQTVNTGRPVHGKTSLISHDGSGVFSGIPSPLYVARYHSLCVSNVNPRFHVQSEAEGIIMAFHEPGWIAGVQFHPESFLTEYGHAMLTNFLEGLL